VIAVHVTEVCGHELIPLLCILANNEVLISNGVTWFPSCFVIYLFIVTGFIRLRNAGYRVEHGSMHNGHLTFYCIRVAAIKYL